MVFTMCVAIFGLKKFLMSRADWNIGLKIALLKDVTNRKQTWID